jgi:hypothetical protein
VPQDLMPSRTPSSILQSSLTLAASGGFFSTAGQGSGAGGVTSGATSAAGAGFTNSQRPRSGTEPDSTMRRATKILPSETAPAPY